MLYYPKHSLSSALTRIRRVVRLPDAASGGVTVLEGQAVDIRDRVARGVMSSQVLLIDAAHELRLSDPKNLKNFMLVKERQAVQEKDAIAGKDAKRGRRVFAPANGYVVGLDKGRILFALMPERLELDAGVRGTVAEIANGREVTIEAQGALVQGAWGNGKNLIAIMRFEPVGGILRISRDALDTAYKNEIIVTPQPITEDVLDLADVRTFGAIIAPSMSSSLLERVQQSTVGIFLTEGFGEARMNTTTQELLKEFDGYQATLDAHKPERLDARRPELVINRSGMEEVREQSAFKRLQRGDVVRVCCAPYFGILAKVLEVPRQPQALPSGLRVLCAKVEMSHNGTQVAIPLQSLEWIGA